MIITRNRRGTSWDMLGSNINIDQNGHMMVLFSWGYYIEVPEPNGGFCGNIIELNRRVSSKTWWVLPEWNGGSSKRWFVKLSTKAHGRNSIWWYSIWWYLMVLLTALNSGQISLVLKPEAGKSFGKPTWMNRADFPGIFRGNNCLFGWWF